MWWSYYNRIRFLVSLRLNFTGHLEKWQWYYFTQNHIPNEPLTEGLSGQWWLLRLTVKFLPIFIFLLVEFIPLKLTETNLRWTFSKIKNGNRTDWSPIRSVIIRVINKIGRPRSGDPVNHEYDYRRYWTTRSPVINFGKQQIHLGQISQVETMSKVKNFPFWKFHNE